MGGQQSLDRRRDEYAEWMRLDKVEHHVRAVVVVVKAELGRVAGPDEVLAVVVGDEDVLLAVLEGVQGAVGVLLGLAEVGDVELVAVTEVRAEQADRALRRAMMSTKRR